MSFFDFLRDKSTKDEATPQTSTSVAQGVSFQKPENLSVPEVVTATDVLAGAYDPAKLHPLAGIGDSLDYLLLDDDKLSTLPGATTALPSRGWSDDLCYGTGTTYLAGLSLSIHRYMPEIDSKMCFDDDRSGRGRSMGPKRRCNATSCRVQCPTTAQQRS